LEGRVNKEWLDKRAEAVRSRLVPKMKKDLLESLKDLDSHAQLRDRLQGKGYILTPETGIRYMQHSDSAVRIDLTKMELNGQPFGLLLTQTIKETRQREADKKSGRGRGPAHCQREEKAA